MSRQLPLFPLGTILFPGMTINLHIFEERYRSMIATCIERRTPFGVVLIRTGDEVEEGRLGGVPAEPHLVGTTAEISANVRLEDGRFLLTAVGRERFTIRQITQRLPYLVASVQVLEEEVAPGVTKAAEELRAMYLRYWKAVEVATGVPVEPDELPSDPATMAYQLADRLQVPLMRKQHWLEAPLLARLYEMASDLRAELALMPGSQDGAGQGFAGFGSLN